MARARGGLFSWKLLAGAPRHYLHAGLVLRPTDFTAGLWRPLAGGR